MEFARFLGLPPIRRSYNATDISDSVCQVLIDARVELVLVDEIHNLNLATSAGEDMSDHLKYFAEHLPATFVYAGINNETIGSYLDRLAAANHLHHDALRAYVAGDRRKSAPIPLERVAILSGQSPTTLSHAIPELQGPNQFPKMHADLGPNERSLVRLACVNCMATHGITTPVQCRLRLEDIVCLRHQRWIGPDWMTHEYQLRLTNHPEIISANRLHRKIIRRHGRQAVVVANREATAIIVQWHESGKHLNNFHDHMRLLRPDQTMVPRTDTALEAATYPQIIALIRLLASPFWRELPLTTDTGLAQFTNEIRRTVAPSFSWSTNRYYGRYDPLVDVFITEATYRARPRPDAYRNPIFISPPLVTPI
jgi:hypothetical protein